VSTAGFGTVVADSVVGNPDGSNEVVGDSAGGESVGSDAPVESTVESPQAASRSKLASAAPDHACRIMKGSTSQDADRFREIETTRAPIALLTGSLWLLSARAASTGRPSTAWQLARCTRLRPARLAVVPDWSFSGPSSERTGHNLTHLDGHIRPAQDMCGRIRPDHKTPVRR